MAANALHQHITRQLFLPTFCVQTAHDIYTDKMAEKYIHKGEEWESDKKENKKIESKSGCGSEKR